MITTADIRKALLDFEVETGKRPTKIFISEVDYSNLVLMMQAILTVSTESTFIEKMPRIKKINKLFDVPIYRVIEEDILAIC